ncbi:hypothetical protein [Rhodanobacter sp. A1T4]|jgi:single-stranded DNA-binding protein|uniref:hypothetical protein n=1 Tax=Rhodanobacter sp. A1T4 TaxID=2723087 RepID=UPI001622B25E|nr:hypothetical protein [Rhodanobacter sp. A1T4]MBB6247078.1 single-stranded DNA-binding protein [Rhodanobacter sp. A1T4]
MDAAVSRSARRSPRSTIATSESWTDKHAEKVGVVRYSTDVIASEMQMLGGMDGCGDDYGQRALSPVGTGR